MEVLPKLFKENSTKYQMRYNHCFHENRKKVKESTDWKDYCNYLYL